MIYSRCSNNIIVSPTNILVFISDTYTRTLAISPFECKVVPSVLYSGISIFIIALYSKFELFILAVFVEFIIDICNLILQHHFHHYLYWDSMIWTKY